MGNEQALFHKYELRAVIENQKQKMKEKLSNLDRDYILSVSGDDLCKYYEQEYRINPIILQKDKIYIKEHGDANVDVSGDYNRAIRNRSIPHYIQGTSVTFALPYEGDKLLFFCQPSSFTMSYPRAQITDDEIMVTFTSTDPDPEKLKADFLKRVSEIEEYLNTISANIKPFNDTLIGQIESAVESRRQKILKDQGMVAALGFPLRESTDSPRTYTVPDIKKKIVIEKPVVTNTPFTPEPTLDMKNYEAILKIISDMVIVMERSPRAFINLGEEDLRMHFLVPLNGHFDGQATGETFNYEGKTDILIRVKGKNIFIAECLYWDGPKSLQEKIDQLLGYTSWRDTKAAILIFNRNTTLSTVISKVSDIVKEHSNFKRQLEYKSETGFRFILHHTGDKNRELYLTILVFDIPKDSKK